MIRLVFCKRTYTATAQMSLDDPKLHGLHRIGTVARQAGLPVSTLRMWEYRHGAFTPAKTSGQHRLYSDSDLLRARLLRQLTEAGHGIGGIARLDADALGTLLARSRAASGGEPVPEPAAAVRALVVGTALAVRLHGDDWTWRHRGQPIDLRRVLVDLQDLEAMARGAPEARVQADLLLVRVNTVHADLPLRLAGAAAALGIARVIVLYAYGAERAVEELRAAGMLVRREPLANADLARLIDAVLLADPAQALPRGSGGDVIPPRRYPDEVLARVAQSRSTVLCECPRHIAELLAQLAAFEQYSAECLNRSPEDAQLHAYLRSVSGSARALFEHALDLVAEHGDPPLQALLAPHRRAA